MVFVAKHLMSYHINCGKPCSITIKMYFISFQVCVKLLFSPYNWFWHRISSKCDELAENWDDPALEMAPFTFWLILNNELVPPALKASSIDHYSFRFLKELQFGNVIWYFNISSLILFRHTTEYWLGNCRIYTHFYRQS